MNAARTDTSRLRYRRLAVRAALCLVVGLVLTTAVAAGALLYSPQKLAKNVGTFPASLDGYSKGDCLVTKGKLYTGFGVCIWTYYACWIGEGPAIKHGSMGTGLSTGRYGWPFAAFIAPMPDFPAHCDAATFQRLVDAAFARPITGNVVPQFMGAIGNRPLRPFRPLAVGLAADTALYALLAGAVLYAPYRWRRSHRRRTGKCVHCGYPLGGVPTCPECGHAVPASYLEGAPIASSGIPPSRGERSPILSFVACPSFPALAHGALLPTGRHDREAAP